MAPLTAEEIVKFYNSVLVRKAIHDLHFIGETVKDNRQRDHYIREIKDPLKRAQAVDDAHWNDYAYGNIYAFLEELRQNMQTSISSLGYRPKRSSPTKTKYGVVLLTNINTTFDPKTSSYKLLQGTPLFINSKPFKEMITCTRPN